MRTPTVCKSRGGAKCIYGVQLDSFYLKILYYVNKVKLNFVNPLDRQVYSFIVEVFFCLISLLKFLAPLQC